jgi:hypothetical protein
VFVSLVINLYKGGLMAKANLVLPDGTKVAIDGTADEVASLLERFSSTSGSRSSSRSRSRRVARAKSGSGAQAKTRTRRAGPTEHIRDLIGGGYFKTKREIGAVRDKLEERAHIYPVTSISGPLYRLVKSKELRRIKEDAAWRYVNP